MKSYCFLKPRLFLYILLGLLATDTAYCAKKDDNAVLLRDVEAISLFPGKLTNGRRTSPVPQLKCVGGTAGCSVFKPKVVQCYNRGWDGQDVQWECKAEMNRAYQFGRISVNCEGYSYPDDPYILRGSCGLEYTIDYSDEGSSQSKSNYYSPTKDRKKTSSFSDFFVIIIILLILYGLYTTCFRNPRSERVNQFSSTNDDQGGPGHPRGNLFGFGRPSASAPPPPGFHPDFAAGDGASCGPSGTRASHGGNSFGGFWTGAATGGLLGYMFGNRNSSTRESYTARDRRRDSDYSSNSNWGGTTSSGFYEQSRSTESSGSVRETSGFGGTSRR